MAIVQALLSVFYHNPTIYVLTRAGRAWPNRQCVLLLQVHMPVFLYRVSHSAACRDCLCRSLSRTAQRNKLERLQRFSLVCLTCCLRFLSMP